jgi:hypothetical protein
MAFLGALRRFIKHLLSEKDEEEWADSPVDAAIQTVRQGFLSITALFRRLQGARRRTPLLGEQIVAIMVYFAFVGGLAALAHMRHMILFGTLFFLIPGLILSFAPMVFFYSAAICVAWLICREFLPPLYDSVAAVALVAFFAYGIPLATHPIVQMQMNEQTAHDKTDAVPVTPADSVALLREEWNSHFKKKRAAPTICYELCQRLLYNGATKRVFVAEYVDVTKSLAEMATYYYIEHRDSCPPPPMPEQSESWPGDSTYNKWGERNNAVKRRVAAGECLMQGEARLSDAQMIFTEHDVADAPDSSPSYYGDPRDVRARRIELWKNTRGTLEIIDRKTQVEAGFLVAPLILWPVSDEGDFAFLYKKEQVNLFHDPRWLRGSVLNEYKRIFGDAVRLPEAVAPNTTTSFVGPIWPDANRAASASEVSVATLFRKALDTPGDDNNQGLKLFSDLLVDIKRKDGPTNDEVELVARAIGDPRLKDYWFIPMYKFGPQGIKLAKPILDRMISATLPRDSEAVRSLSHAFLYLPPGTAKDVAPQIIQVANTPVLREYGWEVVARLGDAGPEVALPPYRKILQTPLENFDSRPHSKDRYVLLGAILGLCKMGDEAKDAVPDLIAYLRDARTEPFSNARAYFSDHVIETLGHFMSLGDLQKELGLSEKEVDDMKIVVKHSGSRACVE